MKKFYNLICDLREIVDLGMMSDEKYDEAMSKITEIESFMAGLEEDLLKCLNKYYRNDLSDKL